MITSFHHTRSDFKIFWNIDNGIDFFIRDFDRKYLAIDPSTETYVIIVTNPKTGAILLQSNLTVVDAEVGHMRLTVSANDSLLLPIGHLRYSIVKQKAGKTVLLYTDRDHGPQSTLEVKYGPIPAVKQPEVILRDDFATLDAGLRAGTFEGPLTVGDGSSMRTFVVTGDEFTGTITFEAAVTGSPPSSLSDWFSVKVETFSTFTGARTVNIEGNYSWLRLLLVDTSGTLEKITVR